MRKDVVAVVLPFGFQTLIEAVKSWEQLPPSLSPSVIKPYNCQFLKVRCGAQSFGHTEKVILIRLTSSDWDRCQQLPSQ